MAYLPINPGRRDPGHFRKKADIGLSNVDNLSAAEFVNDVSEDMKILNNKKRKFDFPSVEDAYNLSLGILKTVNPSTHARFMIGLFDENGIELASFMADIATHHPGSAGAIDYYTNCASNNPYIKDAVLAIGDLSYGSDYHDYTEENYYSVGLFYPTIDDNIRNYLSQVKKIGINLEEWTEGVVLLDPSEGFKPGQSSVFIALNRPRASLIVDQEDEEGLPVYDTELDERVKFGIGEYYLNSSDLTYYDIPTINDVPFIGRYKLFLDDEEWARHITVPAKHKGPSKEEAGGHKWEVLDDLNRVDFYDNGTTVSWRPTVSIENDPSNGFGVIRPSGYRKINGTVIPTDVKSFVDDWMTTWGEDSDAVTIGLLKQIMYLLKNMKVSGEQEDEIVQEVETTTHFYPRYTTSLNISLSSSERATRTVEIYSFERKITTTRNVTQGTVIDSKLEDTYIPFTYTNKTNNDWCGIVSTGQTGKGTIGTANFVIDENTDTSSPNRSKSITINQLGTGKSLTFQISQPSPEEPTPTVVTTYFSASTSSNVPNTCNYSGQSFSIPVTSYKNTSEGSSSIDSYLSFSVIGNTNPSMVSLDVDNSYGDKLGVLYVEVLENSSSSSRSTTITLSQEETNEQITFEINQGPKPSGEVIRSYTLNPASGSNSLIINSVPYTGKTCSVDFQSFVEVYDQDFVLLGKYYEPAEVYSKPDWVTVSITSDGYIAIVNLVINENTGDSRTGEVKIYQPNGLREGLIQTITISQNAYVPTYGVKVDSNDFQTDYHYFSVAEFEAAGGTHPFSPIVVGLVEYIEGQCNVVQGVTLECTKNVSWLNFSTTNKGDGTFSIDFSATQNTSVNPNTGGKIIASLKKNGQVLGKVEIRCSQKATGPTISVDPSSLTFAKESGNKNVVVTSNYPWIISNYSSIPSWIHVYGYTGKTKASGSSTISIHVDENTSGSERYFYSIQFATTGHSETATASLSITQSSRTVYIDINGKDMDPFYSFYYNSRSADQGYTRQVTFNVDSNTNWFIDSCPDWITPSIYDEGDSNAIDSSTSTGTVTSKSLSLVLNDLYSSGDYVGVVSLAYYDKANDTIKALRKITLYKNVNFDTLYTNNSDKDFVLPYETPVIIDVPAEVNSGYVDLKFKASSSSIDSSNRVAVYPISSSVLGTFRNSLYWPYPDYAVSNEGILGPSIHFEQDSTTKEGIYRLAINRNPDPAPRYCFFILKNHNADINVNNISSSKVPIYLIRQEGAKSISATIEEVSTNSQGYYQFGSAWREYTIHLTGKFKNNWSLYNKSLPGWISLSAIQGTNLEEDITLILDENTTSETREFTLQLYTDSNPDTIYSIKISQSTGSTVEEISGAMISITPVSTSDQYFNYNAFSVSLKTLEKTLHVVKINGEIVEYYTSKEQSAATYSITEGQDYASLSGNTLTVGRNSGVNPRTIKVKARHSGKEGEIEFIQGTTNEFVYRTYENPSVTFPGFEGTTKIPSEITKVGLEVTATSRKISYNSHTNKRTELEGPTTISGIQCKNSLKIDPGMGYTLENLQTVSIGENPNKMIKITCPYFDGEYTNVTVGWYYNNFPLYVSEVGVTSDYTVLSEDVSGRVMTINLTRTTSGSLEKMDYSGSSNYFSGTGSNSNQIAGEYSVVQEIVNENTSFDKDQIITYRVKGGTSGNTIIKYLHFRNLRDLPEVRFRADDGTYSSDKKSYNYSAKVSSNIGYCLEPRIDHVGNLSIPYYRKIGTSECSFNSERTTQIQLLSVSSLTLPLRTWYRRYLSDSFIIRDLDGYGYKSEARLVLPQGEGCSQTGFKVEIDSSVYHNFSDSSSSCSITLPRTASTKDIYITNYDGFTYTLSRKGSSYATLSNFYVLDDDRTEIRKRIGSLMKAKISIRRTESNTTSDNIYLGSLTLKSIKTSKEFQILFYQEPAPSETYMTKPDNRIIVFGKKTTSPQTISFYHSGKAWMILESGSEGVTVSKINSHLKFGEFTNPATNTYSSSYTGSGNSGLSSSNNTTTSLKISLHPGFATTINQDNYVVNDSLEMRPLIRSSHFKVFSGTADQLRNITSPGSSNFGSDSSTFSIQVRPDQPTFTLRDLNGNEITDSNPLKYMNTQVSNGKEGSISFAISSDIFERTRQYVGSQLVINGVSTLITTEYQIFDQLFDFQGTVYISGYGMSNNGMTITKSSSGVTSEYRKVGGVDCMVYTYAPSSGSVHFTINSATFSYFEMRDFVVNESLYSMKDNIELGPITCSSEEQSGEVNITNPTTTINGIPTIVLGEGTTSDTVRFTHSKSAYLIEEENQARSVGLLFGGYGYSPTYTRTGNSGENSNGSSSVTIGLPPITNSGDFFSYYANNTLRMANGSQLSQISGSSIASPNIPQYFNIKSGTPSLLSSNLDSVPLSDNSKFQILFRPKRPTFTLRETAGGAAKTSLTLKRARSSSSVKYELAFSISSDLINRLRAEKGNYIRFNVDGNVQEGTIENDADINNIFRNLFFNASLRFKRGNSSNSYGNFITVPAASEAYTEVNGVMYLNYRWYIEETGQTVESQNIISAAELKLSLKDFVVDNTYYAAQSLITSTPTINVRDSSIN